MKINPNLIKDISGTILWENPNPSASSFNAQNIQLNSSDYDCYEIIYLASVVSEKVMSSGRIVKGSGTVLQFVYNRSGTTITASRWTNYISATSLSFDESYDSSNVGSNNARCVPLYVIGYKTGMF